MTLGRGFSVRINARARLNLDEAFSYYEGQSAGLGARFVAMVRASINGLPDFCAHPERKYGIRRGRVWDFPYHLYYKVDEGKGLITIVAIRHERRRDLPGQ